MLVTTLAPVDNPRATIAITEQEIVEGDTLTHEHGDSTYTTRVLCVADGVAYLVAWRMRRLPLR